MALVRGVELSAATSYHPSMTAGPESELNERFHKVDTVSGDGAARGKHKPRRADLMNMFPTTCGPAGVWI